MKVLDSKYSLKKQKAFLRRPFADRGHPGPFVLYTILVKYAKREVGKNIAKNFCVFEFEHKGNVRADVCGGFGRRPSRSEDVRFRRNEF